jgi:hypothetical protein
MGTISKIVLSGSSQGKPIQVTATSSNGTTIHSTGTSSTTIDEVWLYATNNDTISANLTIEYGGIGTASEITLGVPSKSGLSIILAGSILTGTGTASTTIKAYASTTNVVNLLGYINRIVP